MTFEEIVKEHLEFTSKTFPKGTAKGAMIHAMREAEEIIEEMGDNLRKKELTVEYADFFGCGVDSANRSGISFSDIIEAWKMKLTINKARKWKDNGDGSYSHIKEEQ